VAENNSKIAKSLGFAAARINLRTFASDSTLSRRRPGGPGPHESMSNVIDHTAKT
jgi:hypothetical protein